MTTLEIGKQLVDLCSAGKFDDAMKLYSADIVSVEAQSPPGKSPEVRGLPAVVEKSKWWNDNHIVHASTVDGPYPNGDRFAVKFTFDITFKPQSKRFTMSEIGVYTVQGDKIVREEFFYAGG